MGNRKQAGCITMEPEVWDWLRMQSNEKQRSVSWLINDMLKTKIKILQEVRNDNSKKP